VVASNRFGFQDSSVVDDPLLSIRDLFTFSPFGLCCQECNPSVKIDFDEKYIRRHLRKHCMDSSVGTVRSLYAEYTTKIDKAKALGTLEPYRSSNNTNVGFSCICGSSFLKKGNATRHCKTLGCDASKLQNIELIKLCCGRYVSQAQVTAFFKDDPTRITEQFDYCAARAALLPFLPQREKHDHTYTHMFTPLMIGCGGGQQFIRKIRTDHGLIHSAPNPIGEGLLTKIHKHAEDWLLKYAKKNILMVPGNLRAALQTFEGGEVDEISHCCTYTMQHNPSSHS
jgi:hypothetical protein